MDYLNKMKKEIKRGISLLLAIAMIFTSQAFVTFADGMDNAGDATPAYENVLPEGKDNEGDKADGELGNNNEGANQDDVGGKQSSGLFTNDRLDEGLGNDQSTTTIPTSKSENGEEDPVEKEEGSEGENSSSEFFEPYDNKGTNPGSKQDYEDEPEEDPTFKEGKPEADGNDNAGDDKENVVNGEITKEAEGENNDGENTQGSSEANEASSEYAENTSTEEQSSSETTTDTTTTSEDTTTTTQNTTNIDNNIIPSEEIATKSEAEEENTIFSFDDLATFSEIEKVTIVVATDSDIHPDDTGVFGVGSLYFYLVLMNKDTDTKVVYKIDSEATDWDTFYNGIPAACKQYNGQYTGGNLNGFYKMSGTYADEEVLKNDYVATMYSYNFNLDGIKTRWTKWKDSSPTSNMYFGAVYGGSYANSFNPLGQCAYMTYLSDNNETNKWWKALSSTTENTWDIGDIIEGSAPYGKKLDGFYVMQGGYDTLNEFFDDYDQTKSYEETTIYGGVYNVWNDVHTDWANKTPKFFGAIYDEALTIKYEENYPTDEWYELDDGKKWYRSNQRGIQRIELYEGRGDQRKYCFRGGRLEGSARDTDIVTAHNYQNTKKLTIVGWNTKADGTGTFYELGEIFEDDTMFTDRHLTLYAVWQDSSLVKKVEYNSNIDWSSGYNQIYIDGALTGDTTNNPIVLAGTTYTITTVNWNQLKQKPLLKWNTKADGTGKDYTLGATLTDYSTAAGFDDNGKLTLYAIWDTEQAIKFSISYDQNVPTGWTLQGTWDITNVVDSTLPITLASNTNGLKIKEDSTGNIRQLLYWYDAQQTSSQRYQLGMEITANGYEKDDLFSQGRRPSVTLSALWQEVYSVTYVQNLGDYTLEGDWYSAEVSENLEYNPIKTQGDFAPGNRKLGRRNNDIKLLTGWNTKADGTGTAIGFDVTIDESKISWFDTHKELILYAQWTEIKDAYYYTDRHPRIVLAYLDKDATTTTKEKITVFDLTDTSITADSIKSFINNAKPSWATVRGYSNPDTEDADYAYDSILFSSVGPAYTSEDIYNDYRPDFRAMSQLDGYYNNAKDNQMTVFVKVAYKVPGFNLLARKGTGNPNPVAEAWLLYGHTTELIAYLNGQPYADSQQHTNDSLDTSFTGVFPITSAEWSTYHNDDYYKEGGYADTIPPTIVGTPSIISTYENWMGSISNDSDTVNYAFSYTTPPTPVDWMYWYLSDANSTIHFTNIADGHSTISVGQDGDLKYIGLSDVTKKNTITKAVFDTEINAITAKALFSSFESLNNIEQFDNFKTQAVTDMSSMFANAKALINLDLSSFDTSNVTTMKEMFSGCTKLAAIAFSSKFKTNKVNDMSYMFYNCSDPAFTTLDLSYFYSTSLNNVDYMFAGCSNLVTIYASGNFTGEWADNRNNTFDGCTKIKGGNGTELDPLYGINGGYARLDGGPNTPGYFTGVPFLYFSIDATDEKNKVVHFSSTGGAGKRAVKYGSGGYLTYTAETGHALSMHDIVEAVFDDEIEARDTIGMFMQWSKLKRITGIEKLNTSKTTNMKAMFSQCAALEYIDLTHFDTSNVTSMQEMFWQCGSLEQLNLINFDTKSLTSTKEMFYSCTRLETIIVSDRFVMTNVAWADSTQMFYQCDELIGGDGNHISSTIDYTYAKIGKPRKNWYDPEQKGYFSADPTRISDMYYYLDETDPKNVIMHFTNVPTNHIQVAVLDYGIVYYDHLLRRQRGGTIKTVVFDNDISGATTAQAMFKDFKKLVTIKGLNHFNTSNVTDMKEMFSYCLELETLENFNSLSTQNVIDMTNMFEHCEAIKNIDFSNANSASLKNAIAVFAYCTSLTNVTFGNNFTLSNAEGITSLFFNCTSLSYIDLSMFDTSNAVSLGSMFYSCKNLKSLDLRSFDVSKVEEFDNMFGRCESLQNIDLSSFDTSSNKNKSMGGMFGYCYSLENIYVSDNFVTTKVDYSTDMFKDCTKLVGGNGTTFDSTKTDKEYARLDGGPSSSTPGYFSGTPFRVSYKNTTTSPWTNVEWYADSTSLNLSGKAIVIDGSSNNYRYNGNQIQMLASWNTNQAGTGTTYNFGQVINNPSAFTNKDLVLYPVFKTLGSITIDTPPDKTIYYEGEKFDPTGLVLNVNYDGGQGKILWASISEAQKSISPDPIPAGTTQITLTFGDKSVDQAITLKPAFMYWNLSGNMLSLRNDDAVDYTAVKINVDSTTNIQYLDYVGLSDTDRANITTVTFLNEVKPPLCGKLFSGFNSLSTINGINYLDTSDATNMYQMFDSCSTLTELDLKAFDTRKVKNMQNMFNGCSALTKIVVSDNFEVSQVTESDNMFKNCSSLVGNAGTTYKFSKIDKEYARIDGGQSRPGYFSENPFMYWHIDGDTIHYTKDNTTGTYNPVDFIKTSGVAQGSIVYKQGSTDLDKTTVQHAVVDDDIEVKEARRFFADFVNLKDITGLDKLNTSKATNFKQMFTRCNGLTSLDISSFDTTEATSFEEMFANSSKLVDIKFGDNFKTNKATHMASMFEGCEKLEYADLRSFDTRNVENMQSMFTDCSELKSIYASNNFDTTKVTSSNDMFNGCSKLEGGKKTKYNSSKTNKEYARLDEGPDSSKPGYLSLAPTTANWMYWYMTDTDKTIHFTNQATGHNKIMINQNNKMVYDGLSTAKKQEITKVVFDDAIVGATTANSLFDEFVALTDIQNLDKFNTSNVTDMANMFRNNKALANITFGDNFTTEAVTDMNSMFDGCEALTNLDVSKFKTDNATDMSNMFNNCKNLANLDLDKFNTNNVKNMSNMFKNCEKLNKLELSNFNTSNTTKMDEMFSGCSALTTINVSDAFDTANVTSSDNMFDGCTNLKGYKGTQYNNSNPKNKTYARIDQGTSNPGYFSITPFKITYVNNIDSQWTMNGGDWYADQSSYDIVADPIGLAGDVKKYLYDATLADQATFIKVLSGWNTSADGSGTNFDIKSTISEATSFTNKKLTLYPQFKTVNSFAVDEPHPRTTYLDEEPFDKNNTKLKLQLEGGKTATMPYDDTDQRFSITPDPVVAGTTQVNISFGNKSTTFPISIVTPFYWKVDNTDTLHINNTKADDTWKGAKGQSSWDYPGIAYEGMTATDINTVVIDNEITPTTLGGMFLGFSNLTTITNLENIKLNNCTHMTGMFKNCSSLTNLDLSKLNTSNVVNTKEMFSGCSALTSIYVNDDFVMDQVTDSADMFKDCTNLQGASGTAYDATKKDKEYARIDQGSSKPGYLSAPPFMYWYVDNTDPNNKQIHYTKDNTTGNYNPVVFDTQAGPYQGAIVYKEGTNTLNKSGIKKAIFDDDIVAREARQFFADFTDLESIEDLEKLDISKTTSVGQMFSGLSNITDLDISPLNTSNITSMDGMFKNTDKLLTLNFGDNFDTSKVTNMTGMFQGCDSLQYLDLRAFDTRNTTNMENMFNGCRSLESIYVTNNFDTTKVTTSTNMFGNCDALMGGKGTCYEDTNPTDKTYARLDGGPNSSTPGYFSDIPTSVNWMYWYLADDGATIHYTNVPTGHKAIQVDENERILYDGLPRLGGKRAKITKAVFDTDISGATTASHMFMHFSELAAIEDLSKFNTSNVKDMSRMFAECSKITNINGLTNFNTSNVEDMKFMFYSCDKLASLDLSSFNVSKVKAMNSMFADDTELASIKFGDNFVTSNVEHMAEMFTNCTSLTTLDLSKFNTTKVTNMDHMFAADSALVTINVSEYFVTTQVTNSDDMFDGCSSIVGCMDTTYDSSKIDKTYARIDGGTANPGYLSGPPAPRSTLDTNGTPKLYIVAFDGTDGSKKLHAVTKADGQTALSNMIASLEKPDSSCNITGYYIVKSPSKDSLGHRVFLTEDDYKAGYDETTVFVDGADTYTETELINEYNTYAADTDTYDIYAAACYSPFIVSITNADVPTLPTVGTGDDEIVYYGVGDSTDLTGASITVQLSDNTTTTINYSDDPSNFEVVPNTYSLGDTEITLKYKGKEYLLTDDLYVYQDGDAYDIDSITPPTKTVYVEGETFDPTGMVINAHKFPNVTGATEAITYADNPTKFHIPTTALPATTSVTIKYGNFDGCDYDVPITVLKRGQNAEIPDDGKPAKTYYELPHTLDDTDLTGLKVTVNYPAGSTPASQTFEYDTNPEYFDITPKDLSENDTKLTIKIAGTTVEYPIVVEPSGDASSIAKASDPTNTSYFVGDEFDPTGLKINVTYPGGITKTIEYDPETSANFTFNPSTFTSGDTTEVSVTYKGATTTIPVTVKKQVSSVAISPDSNLTNTDYSKGDKFDPTGLVVTVTYDDSTTEDIPYNAANKDLFTFTPSLDHVFDATDVGSKVQVTIGPTAPAVPISEMNNISNDSVAIVKTNQANGTTEVLHNIDRTAFEAALDEAIENGATGFHEYNAAGINDAKNKYNKYTPKTMTKEQALAKYDEYMAAGLTASKFIGASYPAPRPNSGPSGGGGSGGNNTIAYDANGNLQPGAQEVINTINYIPQTSLIVNTNLVNDLKSMAENQNRLMSNARDAFGNVGFGQWLHVPNTTTWYFLSGDFNNQTGSTGTTGFLTNGWYNLGWKGKDEWYRFDANGVMQLGWYQENNKIYFLDTDISSNWYGRAVIGEKAINGQKYTFDASGALIQ